MAFLSQWRWLVLMSLFVVGCATDTSRFSEQGPQQEGNSVIYLYRPAAVANVMLTPEVRVDDSAPMVLHNGEYHRLELPAGQHMFRIDAVEDHTDAQQLAIDSEVDRVYYLRLQASMQFETGVRYRPYRRAFQLAKISTEEARAEIRHCRDARATNPPPVAGDSNAKTETSQPPAVFSIDKNSRPFGY